MSEQPQHPQPSLPEGFPLFVYLQPVLLARLRAQASREGRTLAGVTRRALEHYLRRRASNETEEAPQRAGG